MITSLSCKKLAFAIHVVEPQIAAGNSSNCVAPRFPVELAHRQAFMRRVGVNKRVAEQVLSVVTFLNFYVKLTL